MRYLRKRPGRKGRVPMAEGASGSRAPAPPSPGSAAARPAPELRGGLEGRRLYALSEPALSSIGRRELLRAVFRREGRSKRKGKGPLDISQVRTYNVCLINGNETGVSNGNPGRPAEEPPPERQLN